MIQYHGGDGQAPPVRSGGPDAAEVRTCLDRILQSAEFERAGRVRLLLKYLVEQTLAGHSDSLKESLIGIDVFGREPGYDPKTEPVVRVTAGRLRSKLESYYQREGRDDAVRISIPKGSYVAFFEGSGAAGGEAAATSTEVSGRAAMARRTWVFAATGILVVGGISASLMHLGGAGGSSGLPVLTTVTSFPGGQYFPSLSPDGQKVAFVWQGEDTDAGHVYISDVDGQSPVRITNDAAGDTFPVFSPNGKRIAFIRRGRGLMTADVHGGDERFLSTAFEAFLAWSPDGREIVYCDWIPDRTRFALFAADVRTGAHRQITDPPPAGNDTGDLYADFSPDGKQLVFGRCRLGGCSLFTMAAAGGAPRELGVDNVQGVTWSPDGRTIVFSSRRLGPNQLWRIPTHGSGGPQPIAYAGEGAFNPRFGRTSSGRSRLVFEQRISSANIWRADAGTAAAGGVPQRVLSSTRLDSSPQISPDGTRMAFISDRAGFKEVWLAGADGSHPYELTQLRMEAGSPRWSPDGKRLAFDVFSKQGRAIFLAKADGGAPQQWTPWGSPGRPSWSRDGRWIYFGQPDGSATNQVFKISAESQGPALQMTHDGAFEAFESVGGETLFYLHGKELRRMPAGGGTPSTVTSREIRMGAWSVAANGIYFIDLNTAHYSASLARGEKSVYLLDPANGAVQRVRTIAADYDTALPDFCVSPDGKALYYSVLEVSISQIRMIENGE